MKILGQAAMPKQDKSPGKIRSETEQGSYHDQTTQKPI